MLLHASQPLPLLLPPGKPLPCTLGGVCSSFKQMPLNALSPTFLLISLSEPQFLHMQNGDKIIFT